MEEFIVFPSLNLFVILKTLFDRKPNDLSCTSSGRFTMRKVLCCRDKQSIHEENSYLVRYSFPCLYNDNTVVSVYESDLFNQNKLLIEIVWRQKLKGKGFSINIDCSSDPCLSKYQQQNIFPKEGRRTFQCKSCVINFVWNLSHAKYREGPEPIESFYIAVIVNSQIGLLLGEINEQEANKEFNTLHPMAKFSLVTRKEHIFGETQFSTMVKFYDRDRNHDILINYRGLRDLLEYPELEISIDGIRVVHVNKLQWKFRGNETISLGGLLIELMWNVYDWIFTSSGSGVFIFRVREALRNEFGFWVKPVERGERDPISLLIYAHERFS